MTKVLAIWQNDRRKIADENWDDGLTQAKRKPPVPRKARKQAVLQLVLLTGIEPVWCCHRAVSYTHLDVYKRQVQDFMKLPGEVMAALIERLNLQMEK